MWLHRRTEEDHKFWRVCLVYRRDCDWSANFRGAEALAIFQTPIDRVIAKLDEF
jgi:hypothetical protein